MDKIKPSVLGHQATIFTGHYGFRVVYFDGDKQRREDFCGDTADVKQSLEDYFVEEEE